MSKFVLKDNPTERGFGRVEFLDLYDFPCSLQESSLALLEQPGASAVWFGVEDNRMHLDRERVKVLISLLVEWLDTGKVHGSCCE